ncbi:MAG TPA: glycosyltransferase family 1 protein [Chloroflexia bacterium]|nr:glycosyltransferase family 1 protein [Chloroflexia bacterium]
MFDGRYIQDRYHGIGRYAYHLLSELAAALPDQRFCVLRDPDLADTRFDWAALAARPNVFIQSVRAAPFGVREQVAVPPAALRSRLYHTPYFALPWLLPGRAVITVHDCIFEHDARYMPKAWARRYYRLLMAMSLARASVVCVPSAATAADVRRFYRVPRRKLRTTPEAADPNFRPTTDPARQAAVRAQYGLPTTFVLAVGARRPHKNFARLVEAVRPLPDLPLVFVGTADPRFVDTAGQAARALGDQVHFLGSVPEADLPVLYSLATVVGCPSLIEGFGLPVLEAMACGTPVVASAIPVFSEIAGDAAVLVPHGSTQEWTTALHAVATDSARRDCLSRAGLARARRFSWARAAEVLLPLYRTLD